MNANPPGRNDLMERLLLAAAALLAVPVLLLASTTRLTAAFSGQRAPRLRLPELLHGLPALPRQAGDPAGAVTGGTVHQPAALWWLTLILQLLALAAAGVGLLRAWTWSQERLATGRADAPPRSRRVGFASRRDIRDSLSAAAARRRTSHLPTPTPHDTGRTQGGASATASRLRGSRPEQGLFNLGRALHTRQRLWGSPEDSYLYLGPPRSGKGVHLVIPHTVQASGAVLVTGTRPDTLTHTLAARKEHGPVAVFDPQQLAPPGLPRLRWAPQHGCADPLVAIGRARALAAGSKLTAPHASDGDFWTAMTEAVLRCYLHAAALDDCTMRDILDWTGRPQDPTPARILRTDPRAAAGWAEELSAQAHADPRQRDSVWAGVRRALDSLADPRVLDTASPDRHDTFDAAQFLRDRGTIYLLGSSGTQLSVAPLITALVEDLVETARQLGAADPTGRLTPPVTLVLDEAANIAPLPSLPNLLADGGGSGITTMCVLQSLAQARRRWTDAGADALWDAATLKVVLGGLAHTDDLRRISQLAGEIDEPVTTHSRGDTGAGRSTTVRRVPTLPPETLRTLPVGRALVLARRTPPLLTTLTPWWQQQPKSPRPAGGMR